MWYPGRQILTHRYTSTEGCVTCGIQVDKYQQTEILVQRDVLHVVFR